MPPETVTDSAIDTALTAGEKAVDPKAVSLADALAGKLNITDPADVAAFEAYAVATVNIASRIVKANVKPLASALLNKLFGVKAA